MQDLKPREGASGVEVVAPRTLDSWDQLPHVSRKVVLWRHFRCDADASVPEKEN
jgi:hypothetical protein